MAFPVFCFEVTFSSYFSDNIWPEFYKIAGWLEWQCRVFHIIKSTNKFKKKNMPFVLLKEMLLPPLCGEQLPLQPQNIPKSTCSGHSQATWLGTAVHGIFLDPSIKTPRNDCVCVGGGSYYFSSLWNTADINSPHSDAQFQLRQVFLIVSTCLNPLCCFYRIGWLDICTNKHLSGT